MKKQILLFVVLIGFGTFFFVGFQRKPTFKRQFIKIPIHFFPFGNRATMQVEVEGKQYSLLIDLGSSHPLDLHEKFIQKIKDKKLIGVSNYKNIRGDVFTSRKFQIPAVKILNWTIKNLVVCEESVDFINAAEIWPSIGIWNRVKDELQLVMIQGRIGLPVFKESDCFFDFPNSVIFLGNNLGSCCSLEGSIQIPFELEECGVILSVDTDLGMKKFLLDTGFTHSVLRESLVEKKGAKKTKRGDIFYVNKDLIIGGHSLGGWQFWLLEFSDIFKCDGIFGIDFFKKHAIYLDFHNKVAYIKRHQTVQERWLSWANGFPKSA